MKKNPFLGMEFYKKIEKTNDENLKKILVMLYIFSENRKKYGKKGDELVINFYKEIEKKITKTALDKTKKFLKVAEKEINTNEMKNLDKKLNSF